MPARAEYRALRTISVNAVNAYQPGDDVYASAVDNLGLEVGVDVEPSGQKLLSQPAGNASRAAWAAYALDQGKSQAEIDDLGRDDIKALFDEDSADGDSEG